MPLVKSIRPVVLSLVLALLAAPSSFAAAFQSISSGNWNNGSTWNQSGAVPGSGDTVEIIDTHTVTVTTTADTAASVSFGTLAFGATLQIDPGAKLTLVGNLAVDADALGAATLDVGSGTLVVGGNIAINEGATGGMATLRIGSGSASSGGNVTFAPVFGNVRIDFTGAGLLSLKGSLDSDGTLINHTGGAGSTVKFDGTGSQTIGNYTYQNLGMANTGASPVEATGAFTVNGTLAMQSGSFLVKNSFTAGGTATLQMTGNSILKLGDAVTAFGVALPNFGGGYSLASTTTIYYGANASQNINPAPTYQNLFVAYTGSVGSQTKQMVANTNILVDLTIDQQAPGSVTLDAGAGIVTVGGSILGDGGLTMVSGGELRLAGNFNNSGTFSAGTGLFVYNGGQFQNVRPVAYNDLHITGTNTNATLSSNGGSAVTLDIDANSYFDLNTSFTVSGALIVDGFLNGTGDTLTLSTSGNSIFGSGEIYAHVISGTRSIVAAADLLFGGNFTVNTSETVTNNGTVEILNSLNGASATWVNAVNSTLSVGGNVMASGTLNASANPNTVRYNGLNQTVLSATYHHLVLTTPGLTPGLKTMPGFLNAMTGNLTISGAANVTAASGLFVAGSVTLGGTSTFDAGNFAHTVLGDWIRTGGTFTPNISSLQFQGANQTIDASPFHTVMFGGTGVKTINGNLDLSGDWGNVSFVTILGGTHTINVAGSWDDSLLAFNPGTGTVILDGSGAGTIYSGTFHKLQVSMSGAGSVSLDGNVTTVDFDLTSGTFDLVSSILDVADDFKLFSGSTFKFSSGSVYAAGPISTSGTMMAGSGTFKVDGSGGNQAWGGTAPPLLHNLTVDKSSGSLNPSLDLNVSGFLTLDNGVVVTGSNAVKVTSGQVLRTSGYIDGRLDVTHGTTGAKVYPLGTTFGYSPVAVTIGVAGQLDISIDNVPQPDNTGGNANILQTYWTIHPSTVTGLVDLAFEWPAGAVNGNEASYVLARYDGTSWTQPTATVTPVIHLANAGGVAVFTGDWTVGEPASVTTSYDLEITTDGAADAGVGESITITAKDGLGNTITSYSGDHTLVFAGPATSPNGTVPTASDKNSVAQDFGDNTVLTFTAGVATTNLLLYASEAPFVNASEPSTSTNGSGVTIAVSPGPATTLDVSDVNAGNTLYADAPFTLSITATDAYGNPSNVVANTDITLSTSGCGGCTGTLGGTPLTLQIPSGNTTANFSGLTYSVAEANVVIGAAATAGDSLTGTNSAPLTFATQAPGVIVTTDADGGAGSLRDAIDLANSGACGTPCNITFDILPAGPYTFQLTSRLPNITVPVVIDGTTQDGFIANPILTIDGSLFTGSTGFELSGGNSTVKGFNLQNVSGAAVQLASDGNAVQNCWIGTDVTGASAEGNGTGISITGNNNYVGGASAVTRNVISGNTTGILLSGSASSNTIRGNYIGTDATGNAAVGNGTGISLIQDAGSNTIGGTSAGQGNVISGNTGAGIALSGGSLVSVDELRGRVETNTLDKVLNNEIIGNYIGVSQNGTSTLGNLAGIELSDDAEGTIIGQPGDGNVISGNSTGIILGGSSVTATTIQSNLIGVAADGTTAAGNVNAAITLTASSNNLIGGLGAGEGNDISHNGGAGVRITGAGSANAILGNSMHSYGTLPIDLDGDGADVQDPGDADTGANGNQNYPLISTANVNGANLDVTFSVNSSATAAGSLRIELFESNVSGEPLISLGTACFAGNNLASMLMSVPVGGVVVGDQIVATATSFTGGGCTTIGDGTSEVSPATTASCVIPTVTITGPTSTCPATPVTLDAGAGFLTYAWSTGDNTRFVTVTPTGTTTYTVTVTGASGCPGSDSHIVTLNTPTPVTITGPSTACDSATLNAGAGFASYLWTTGAITPTINVTTSGTYGVTVTDANGCTATDSHAVTITTTPGNTITASGPTTFCTGGSVILTASTANSYSWSTGATTQSITVTTGGSYSVQTTNGSCTASSSPVLVTVNPPPTANITGPTNACTSATLDAGLFASYLWSTGETTRTIIVSTTGTYSVTVTNAGGCTAADSHAITIDNLPGNTITAGGPTTFCAGGNVVLTASNAASYLWTTGATTQSITVTTPGSYSVQTSNGSCTATSAPVTVTVKPLPVVTITGPATACDSATLDAGPGFASYLWNTGATTPTINVTTTGIYSVTVTAANGCSASDTHNISITSTPGDSITPGGPTTFCDGGSVVLTASTANSYLWSTGETTQSITVSTSGSFSVQTSNGSCTATSGPIGVTVTPAPNVTIIGPASACDAAVLDAGAGWASYLWSNGATTPTTTVTSTGTYSVTVTSINGCSGSTTHNITITPTTPVTIAGPSSACDSAVLDAGAGFATYLWSNGATTQSITVTTSGTYNVTVTNGGGCTASDSHVIAINGTLTPVITGPTTACTPDSVTLDAGAGFTSYLWSTGATTRTINVTTTGTYNVTVTTGAGCSGSDSHSITFNSAPPASITAGGPTTFCSGGDVTLTASAGAAWLWSTGETTQSITTGLSGSYSVTVTAAAGCTSTSAPVTVTSNPSPGVDIQGPTSTCAGTPVTLDAGTGFASYLWSTGATTQTITVAPTSNSIYSVTVTNGFGCSGSDTQPVNVSSNPTATIAAPANLCANATGQNASVAAQSGATYAWTITNGTITSAANTAAITFTAGATGNVTLNVTVTKGACVSTGNSVIPISAQPVATITAPSSATSNATGLTASVPLLPGATYVWGDVNATITSGQGTNAVTFSVGDSGTAKLTVNVTKDGCSASAGKNITITGGTQATADLAIAKSAPATVNAGANLTYTLLVTNHGPSNATDITITDALPLGTTLISINDGPWTCSEFSGGVFCNGNLTAGANSTVTITVAAPQQGGTITNTANVDAGNANDPVFGNNSSSATTTVLADTPGCSTVPPALLAPANGAEVSSPVAFSWSAVTGASEYEVWLVTDDGTFLAGTTNTTSLVKALTSGAGSWYVVARFTGDCTPLVSAQRTFTVSETGACRQAGPQLTSPAASSTAGPNVTFAWTPVPGAIGYRVWVEANGTAAQDVGTTDGAITLTADVATGALVAYVDALFSGCPTGRSTPVAFNVAAPDPCAGRTAPSTLFPANGVTIAASSIDFSWTAAHDADGYRLWAEIDGGDAEVLGETGETSFTATIAGGTVRWWVEALYNGCASTESQRSDFTIPKRNDCSTQRPELVAPANNSTVSLGNVTFTWSSVQNAVGYELWLAPDGGMPALVATTTSPLLQHTVTPGRYEWFVRALVDRCPSRDSQTFRFTFTPPANCLDNQRPIATAPLSNAKVASPVSFAWSTPPGATSYEVFVIRGNQTQRVATSTSNHTGPVSLSNGRLRWFVRASFGNGCTPLDSGEERLEVVAPPAACAPLTAPEIASVGQISSGVPFSIQWTEIAGATSYQLQLASDSQFSDAQLISTGDTQHHLTRTNLGATPLTLFARVRAIDSRCKPEANITPYGPASAIFILPVQGTDAAAPVDGGIVTYNLPLGPELAGQSFSASSKETWITVVPSSGVVPAGGLMLVVTANTNGLPLGTSLSAIRITLDTPAAAGGVGTNATTLVLPVVGISKATPVNPQAKSAPPPDALIIPAVAHADGLNSKFQSDVRVTNTSSKLLQYQVTFTPSGGNGLAGGKQTTFSIEPGRTIALDDVLRTWFGTGGDSSIGTLEIRPLTQTAATTPGVALRGLPNLATFASSRTFNLTANGTFGQYIPAVPFANFIGVAGIGGGASSLSLQQIAQSVRYRTNLGIVEGSGQPASLMVKVFGETGQKLTEFPVQLKGGEHTQLNAFLASNGISTLNDGRVEISVIGGGGKVTAYASVLDNDTNDPLLVTPVTITDTGDSKWVMPGVADIDNGTANWQTDMRVFNGGTEDVTATFSFYSQNGGAAKAADVTIPAGQVRQFDRTLSSVFGVSNDGGAVHISTPAAARLVATARTYNQTSGGTYGQFISAVTPAESASRDTRALQILQVEESARFRTNLGLAEVTGNPVTVQLSIVTPDTKTTAFTELTLAPNEFRQLPAILRSFGLGDTFNARITVRVIDGTGRVTAYGSMIDQRTNDPTYVPAQ
jgi:uncharacterized repeat protein (TIGR01451 family)